MAYPMLGTAVCPETPRLMVKLAPYFIIGRMEKKIRPNMAEAPPMNPEWVPGAARPLWARMGLRERLNNFVESCIASLSD
jgi:hypothetical protein